MESSRWTFLKISGATAAGTVIGLQIVAYDPSANDQNITGGAGPRRALFRSGSVLSLKLAETTGPVAPLAPTAQKRDWFGSIVVCGATESALPTDSWSTAVAADERSFRAEVAVPLRVLRPAGLTRDRLLAQFHTFGKATSNLDLLYNSFQSRSVRIATGSVPWQPAPYTVRLHFAELEDKQPGQRVFDIRLQGRLVAQSLDIVREAGGPRRLLTNTFHVTPDKELVLEFLPQAGTPLLNGLELIRDPAAGTR